MVAVLILRAGVAAEDVFVASVVDDVVAAEEPHASVEDAAGVVLHASVAGVAVDPFESVAATVEGHVSLVEGAAAQPEFASNEGESVAAAVASAQDGVSSVTPSMLSAAQVIGADSEVAAASTVLAGRVCLSPPFWARGPPLVEPPRPPRKPSKTYVCIDETKTSIIRTVWVYHSGNTPSIGGTCEFQSG